MTGICDGRVVVVTGGGRGLGRAHAREYAHQGAKVVVVDPGFEVDGSGGSPEPADTVADEIRAAGGEAVSSYEDAADWEGAQRIVNLAVETYGGLDVLVNNAGTLRDRMLVNMTEEEWDAIAYTHLRGTFAPTRWAATYWRERVKGGLQNDARVINVSSPSGLYGNVGQSNYGAAKAGIAAFTVIASQELGRYGIAVNAIAPSARTRMTEGLGVYADPDDSGFDLMAPEHVAPLVVWLGSPEAAGITGRVFNIGGGRLSVAEGWHAGPGMDREVPYDVSELGALVPELVGQAAGNADMSGRVPT